MQKWGHLSLRISIQKPAAERKQQHKYLLKCRMPEYFDSRSLKEPVTVKVIMLLVAKARSRLKEVASWSVLGSPDRNDTMGSRPLDVNYRF